MKIFSSSLHPQPHHFVSAAGYRRNSLETKGHSSHEFRNSSYLGHSDHICDHISDQATQSHHSLLREPKEQNTRPAKTRLDICTRHRWCFSMRTQA